MKSNNLIWNFFASVKLALFTLGCLAITSIIGTIIPQKEAFPFYAGKYGTNTANFFQLFDLTDMYTSWWFLALLGLLSANLIVCSIDRFPGVWRQIKKDNLDLPLERIEKTGKSITLPLSKPLIEVSGTLPDLLSSIGWKASQREKDGAEVFFSQKTPWSRTGVYIVHLSILVIFVGAIYGQITGFKGSIMLPELQSSEIIYPFDKKEPIPLDFEIRCERFDIEFYSNNMPREFTSQLTVLEKGKIVLQKDIEVNDPLKYKGITFYQSSYQAYKDFFFTVSEEEQKSKSFTGGFQKEITWKEQDVYFGIINLETIRDRVSRMKIWFNDNRGAPATQFWMDAGDQVKIQRPGKTYIFSAKQRYATGLQVAKDPGVWIVYLGCGLMLLGLYIAFFMSHQRIWLILRKKDDETVIDLRGTTNKNKAGFEKTFEQLAATIQEKL